MHLPLMFAWEDYPPEIKQSCLFLVTNKVEQLEGGSKRRRKATSEIACWAAAQYAHLYTYADYHL